MRCVNEIKKYKKIVARKYNEYKCNWKKKK